MKRRKGVKARVQATILLLMAAAPALAKEWATFPMGEGPDLRVDVSSAASVREGSIVPWAKEWMAAKTERGPAFPGTPGYFVTDCAGHYYLFDVDAKTGTVREPDAQPLTLARGSVAQNVADILCARESGHRGGDDDDD
jgi:hypothetical protein